MKKILLGYENKPARNLFLLCWVAYFSTYLCRLNYSAVMPELTAGKVYSASQIAAVSSCFFICYGVGQFINGFAGDKIAPRQMVFWGLLVSGVCNIVLAFVHPVEALLAVWGLNGFVQSMIWSPILRLAGEHYDEYYKQKFGIDISTTVPLGTLCCYGLCLLILQWGPWHHVFLVCGALVAAVAFLWLAGTRNLQKMPKAELPSGPPADSAKALPMKAFLRLILISGLLLLLLPIAVHGALKDSVTQWVPTFISQQFSSGTGLSLLFTMALPVVNVTGAYLARMLNRKLRNEVATCGVFFLLALAFLGVLFLFGKTSLWITVISLCGITTAMFAVNVMTITLIPLRFSRYGRTSSMSGFLNSVAYVGCGAANLVTGHILERFSWNGTIVFWMGLGAAALLLCAVCLPLWKRFRAGEEQSPAQQG